MRDGQPNGCESKPRADAHDGDEADVDNTEDEEGSPVDGGKNLSRERSVRSGAKSQGLELTRRGRLDDSKVEEPVANGGLMGGKDEFLQDNLQVLVGKLTVALALVRVRRGLISAGYNQGS